MNRFLNIAAAIIMLIPAAYLAIDWNTMPEKVTLHFDWKGQPDRTGDRSELLWMVVALSALNALIYLLLANVYRIDPKKHAAENRSRLKRLAFGVVVFMSVVLCIIIYSSSHGNISISVGLILAAVGLLFAFMGNYMHNIKPNYFAGFRLPWTLENEENWKKTHALASKLWFSGGLLIALLCVFLPSVIALIVFFAIMVPITLIPIIFSYRLYKKQQSQLRP